MNIAYEGLCRDVMQAHGIRRDLSKSNPAAGVFSAEGSAMLLNDQVRVRGFLNAIARTKNVQKAIDAGTGAVALLAAATAIAHPSAHVFAYEIDTASATCAYYVVDLLGLRKQITVVHGDVLTAHLPDVDLAVTETFYKGLRQEMGHLITPVLAQHASEILPATVIFFANDAGIAAKNPLWVPSATINLADLNDHVVGCFASTDSGNREVCVYTGFYDARADAILDAPGTRFDSITAPIRIGEAAVSSAGLDIHYSYSVDPRLPYSRPAVWST